MRIKKLELSGFKSFKDRTVIHFDANITGVVGPNGCGKSNIVDALVWVMGEMSAKHLRGSSMEDVIFAGADGYAPVGLAEVSLTLENDGGAFPVKYLKHSEIMVTRRLHRSGDSEYFLNKEPARLKDIQEVFMDTGAGSKGFSIVEQGAIGRIVTAKPEDRRTLIEEAAGITKFKARKRESQRKLQSTEQNLIRLQDIIVELKRQLDSLQRQAQRAERYRKLKNEIEDLELWISSKQYLDLRERSVDAEGKFNEVQEKLLILQNSMGTEETDIETMRNEIAIREAQIQEFQREAEQSRYEVQRAEKEIQQLRFDIEQARQKSEMAGTVIEESQARGEVLQRDLDRVTSLLENVREEAESLQEQFGTKKEDYDEIHERIQEIDRDLSDRRRELLSVTQAESSLDAKTQSLEESLESIHDEEIQASQAHQEVLEQTSQFEKHKKKVTDEVEREKQLHLDLVADVETLAAQKQELQSELSEKRSEVETFKDELNKVTSRLYGLENLQDNLEGFQEGVKTVMFWQRERLKNLSDSEKENQSQFKPMAEVVEVPKEYEIAMEAALGPRLQMLLSTEQSASLEAVQFLKQQNKGRSSFYSLDGTPQEEDDHTPQFSHDGFKSYLKDVIKYPQTFEPLIERLLGRVAVVEDLQAAMELKKNAPHVTFVTLEGDMISPEGILTAGSQESADSGVLKRRREIKELSYQKEEWSGKLALAQEVLVRLEQDLKNVTRDLEEAQKKGTEREIILAGLKKDLERALIEFENAQRSMQKHERLVQEIQEKKSRRQAELLTSSERLNELRERKQELETDVEQFQLDLLQARNGVDGLQSEVTRLQVESAKKTQEFEGLNREYDMLSRSLDEVRQQLAKMTHESDRSLETMSGSSILLQEKQLDLEKMIQRVEMSQGQLAEMRDEYEKKYAEMRKFEDEVNHQRRDQSSLQTALSDLRIELEQARMKESYLTDQIRERYMIELSEVAENYREREMPNKEHERELKELKEKISKIGEVNLSAIDEFDDTAKRYEFLKTQQDDLNEAKEQLRKVIDRINRICARRFKETFDAVNERFVKVFPVLFGGGEARLILIEDPEKGEMGIDIVAKPPGKKSQSVTLLSGGEKALTAVSLIFSIFLVKPSPYCLLDEVDAPLDDANVMRFNDLVREMAKRSQIILVTHNKNTMQIAERLYGVTMEEKGVSKMVSVSLGQAQAVVGR